MIDVQQIIPRPEAHDYQIQLREKEQQGRRHKAERHDLRLRFWQGVVALARDQKTRHSNIKPGTANWISARSGVRGLSFNYVIVQEHTAVELYIDRGHESENKDIFDRLSAHKREIEKTFGGPLSWERLDGKRACRIKYRADTGGYRSPDVEWPAIQSGMVEAMGRLEAALLPVIESLGM
jgi:hypothetical protein